MLNVTRIRIKSLLYYSTINFVIFRRLSLSNMFDILNPLESADGSWPTIGVSRRKIGLVGTGLKRLDIEKMGMDTELTDAPEL